MIRYRSFLTLVCLLATSGCYTYQRSSPAEVGPGQDIRVRLTGSFADSLGPILMTDDARVVEGAIVERNNGSLMLEVSVNSQLQGIRMETLSQRVLVPTEEMVDVEVKELSKGRTYGAIGLIVGVGVAIVVAQLSGDSGGASTGGPGGPVESVVSPSGFTLPMGILGRLFGS